MMMITIIIYMGIYIIYGLNLNVDTQYTRIKLRKK